MELTRIIRFYPNGIRLLLLFLLLTFFTNSVYSQYQNVVINEISGDGGNVEAGNDAIVELAGIPGTDIGCMVITNTEWAIVLPAGTKIPADGVFSIGCEERNNNSTGFYTGLSTGLSCAVCDFPGLVLDFDVCSEKNVNYISTSVYSTYGFTLDNQTQDGNKDGDQVILFQPDGTPHDAVYWGAPDMTNSNGGGMTVGGSSGNAGSSSDHVSIQINHPYTLGDNDENGIVNDYTGSHIGYRANGKNAVSVYLMPSGNDDLGSPELFGSDLNIPPGDCEADQKKYTVPALSDPVWVSVGLNLSSCNSTHIRLNDISPIGNSVQEPKSSTTSSHMDDPDLNADWMIFDPTALMPSSINLATATAQWQVTNHPNPGEPNDKDAWDFFYDIGAGSVEITNKNEINISLCNAQMVEFELKVYNYQHVEPAMRSAKLAGSFVRDELGIDQDWTIAEVGHDKTIGSDASSNNGTTTFSFTSNSLAVGMTHSFTLVWDDFTDCCGSGSNNTVVNQSVAHECYEKVKVNITVAEVLMVSDNTITCPGDYNANIGLIDFSELVTSTNAVVRYQLKEGVTTGSEASSGTIISTNTTGVFNLPTTLTPPLAVVIEDLVNCGVNQIITIEADCRNVPPCPDPNGATISATTVCPGEDFTLAIDTDLSTDLPSGGTIDWYYGAVGFDPFNQEGTLLGQSAITTIFPNVPTTGPVINEVLVDAADNDGNGGEFIEIAGVPGTDLSCFILTDGDDEIILPDGTQIPSDGYLLIASGKNTDAPFGSVDIDLDNCSCFSDPIGASGGTAADLQFTNHSVSNGEFLFLYNATGTFIDGILWGGPTVGGGNNHPDATPTHNITITSIGCAPSANVTRSGQAYTDVGITSASNGVSIELDIDVIGAWQSSDNMDGFTAGTTNSGELPMTTVSDLIMNVGEELCNQTIEIKGIVQPATITAICSEAMVTTAALSLTIECPVADLQTGDQVRCLPVNNSDILATINLSNGSGTYNTTIQLNHNGSVVSLVKNNATNPLVITYYDIATALGTPTFSEVELTVISVNDVVGKMCNGKIDEDLIELTVQAAPTASIISSTDLTDCSGVANGSITFEFSPISSGPWAFEYTINGSAPIASATNVTPFVLPVSVTGEFKLESVTNVDGCMGTIGTQNRQTVNAPVPLVLTTVSNPTACDSGTEPINLSTDVDININNNGTALMGTASTIGNITWYSADLSLLPTAARASILLSPVTFTPVTEQDYYFVYERPSDGCEVIGKTTVSLSNTTCCIADAGNIVRPIGGVIDAITGNQSICAGDDLAAFSNDYIATDETTPVITEYETTFLLTNSAGLILQATNDGNFDFSILSVGTYDVFVLNYRTSNTQTSVLVYLAQLPNGKADGTGGNITEIVKDDMDNSSYGLSTGSTAIPNPSSFGTYCLDLDQLDNDGLDADADKVQITINALPEATVNNAEVCKGVTSVALTLSTTGGTPTMYSIGYDGTSEGEGFVDVATTSILPTKYIIPNGVISGTYTGIFTYIDAQGCMGTDAFTVTVKESVIVEAGDAQSICSTGILNLASLKAGFKRATTNGTWSTSGSGFFDVSGIGNFTTATTYKPSLQDISDKGFVLTLISTNAISPCPNQSDHVPITIINVSCNGDFPWNGKNK